VKPFALLGPTRGDVVLVVTHEELEGGRACMHSYDTGNKVQRLMAILHLLDELGREHPDLEPEVRSIFAKVVLVLIGGCGGAP